MYLVLRTLNNGLVKCLLIVKQVRNYLKTYEDQFNLNKKIH